MQQTSTTGRRRGVRAVLAATAVTLAVAQGGFADDLDEIERKGQQLLQQLQQELDAARREREALKAEREQFEAERRRFEAERTTAPAPATAAAPAATPSETDRKVDILASEIEQLKTNVAVPPTADYKSKYGLGPAASKVYSVARGLSIGGYGEGIYTNTVGDTQGTRDTADALRFVLYTGYKFTDWLVLNSEIEFEHATTSSTVSSGSGSVSVEFLTLDFLARDYANLRMGLVLVPMGFINEIHEPVFFHGANRPEVERVIIPTTWRELGAGIFGEAGDFTYRAYTLTSLNADGFSSSGIRNGRQNGNRSFVDSYAGTGRLDYEPAWAEGLLVGGSFFVGGTTQDQAEFGNADGLLTLWDAHMQYRWRGIELRALGAWGYLDDAKSISNAVDSTVANQFDGFYLEAAYDVMPVVLPQFETQYLAPFFRYEHFDTQQHVPSGLVRDATKDTELYTVGLTYKPHPQIVLKLDYRNFQQAQGERADDVNIGAGFVF
jgi:hypothetical protein